MHGSTEREVAQEGLSGSFGIGLGSVNAAAPI